MVSITGILRRLGPVGRKLAWNREFRSTPIFVGRRSSTMMELVRRYGEGKAVVELACGEGSLSRSLSEVRFRSYHGFDISDVAIERARADAPAARRFDVCEMQDWSPAEPFDLLVIEEAIYYLSPLQVRQLLDRTFTASPSAIAVIAVYSTSKHQKSLEACRQSASVIEDLQEGSRAYLVLKRKA